MRWVVLVPMKALPRAKTRLATGIPDPVTHARLVDAIRADTRAALTAAPEVAVVVPVVDVPGGAPDEFVQSRPGLNGGLAEAADWARARWPEHGIAALVADLPALRPAELSEALQAAAVLPRSFVADAQGSGTTLLAVTPGHELRPAYGPGSADRHAADAAALDAGPGLRHDVDTTADLYAARELGLGPATEALLAESSVIVRSPRSGIMSP